ncbi:MAG: DUF59 domain-containing protein [Chitinivibrionales bacterium]|nr:DUF59 domain-containing protein [Chitinivibrionales bacterium]
MQTNLITKGNTEVVDKVMDALRNVIDPEWGYSLVDLGLIYRVEAVEERIEIDYTLTDPGCPVADEIYYEIIKYVYQKTDNPRIVAKLVWTPSWGPEFMSEEARLEFGFPI